MIPLSATCRDWSLNVWSSLGEMWRPRAVQRGEVSGVLGEKGATSSRNASGKEPPYSTFHRIQTSQPWRNPGSRRSEYCVDCRVLNMPWVLRPTWGFLSPSPQCLKELPTGLDYTDSDLIFEWRDPTKIHRGCVAATQKMCRVSV